MLDTISIIGLGYIGLPTATLFASRRHRVIGVDVSPYVVDTINRGGVHIEEPELDILVQAAVGSGYLRATMRPEPADAFVIAVPTPLTEDQKPDVSYIEAAAQSIAPVLAEGNLVILESTSPVGTTGQLAQWLAELRPDLTFPQQTGDNSDIRIAYCPERVLPGRIVHELVANDRIVGGMTLKCSEAASALYKLFVQGECVVTQVRVAEMCKLAENSFRDVNIALANELSMICDGQGIDVWELIRLANRHPRVNILQPGCGVGGHCIAIDPWFIVHGAPDDAKLIRSAREVNDAKPAWVIRKVERAVTTLATLNIASEDIRIACLGVTYKADVDDLRESPALKIALALADRREGRVAIVEPNLQTLPEELTSSEVILMSPDEAVAWAHILVLLVDHAEFKCMEFGLNNGQVLIDTRGIWKDKK
ncbi:UDP-N-acetyl-D-mannosamine dehydrogenase [Paraburkholderia susongensis]|uniref:NDP-N-acetyl-D-galactosaminuronic acid dehydrogenase n=1 Tax=Paraburkholderia susongensis TaxID=1515439 RepID=A0A1X7LRL9_9BURK|nr:UDP-N-acetyl-D-mannosamine dehydrogenase [Paraburkholderia susongensis]SMG56528.1 UDP-N-acetyl-D-mannosaminuronic acid dehydrogenase [Paraburkholderia susongensis]